MQDRSGGNVQPLADGWLPQNGVCGALEQEYFLLSGSKSVYLGEDPTSAFAPMH